MRSICRLAMAVLLLMVIQANSMLYALTSPANTNGLSDTMTIAVASNFRYTLEQIIANSPYWSSQNISVVTGSSGVLYAQIIKGAPFDVFLSADMQRPRMLVEKGLAQSIQIYAKGRLVLWPLMANSKVVDSAQPRYLQYLKQIDGKLAIADPLLAPFGIAAMEVIESDNSLANLRQQLVKGSNVNQAFQFVNSGNAQAGLIAESLLIQAKQVLGSNKYQYFERIPESAYQPINQGIVVIERQSTHPEAKAFVKFMLSESSQSMLNIFGYDKP